MVAAQAERATVCFPRWGTQDVTKSGDDDFDKELNKWYSGEESKALEDLIELKGRLREIHNDEFWVEAVEGLSRVVGSEFAFVMKRLLVDDQDTAVEMPPIGEPGSCLMAAALHYSLSDGSRHTVKQNKYYAYACPCAYMRHDKIFVIPEKLDGFITNNPNTIPIPVDSYMALPLFAEGKCFAHFGVMWTAESNPRRRFSWAFTESLMHSLEDMFAQRLVEGGSFLRPERARPEPDPVSSLVIPHEAVSIAQSLRPYAGSLSHELRTPMQGVVGMLDVMYATVQEAVQTQDDPHLRKVFQNLKESIEVVQDSSRRAVVAADNVVHAYDMNMSIPDSISPTNNPSAMTWSGSRQPDIVVAGQQIPLASSNLKRRRVHESEDDHPHSPTKLSKLDAAAVSWSQRSEPSQEIKAGLHEAENVHIDDHDLKVTKSHRKTDSNESRASPRSHPANSVRRSADIRAVMKYVINEGLKTGGRPDSMISTPIDDGELIEVRSRGSDGSLSQKHIKWTVDEALPTHLNFDEKDFSKLVSCVVLNAIKFTDRVDGRISVEARSPKGRHLSIKITDNGPGMPADFLPKLFRPFSQENGSLTRQSDGLGLGLMVAKGISRKLGGDLICTKAEVERPQNGCEFEIKLPLNPNDIISRSSSPCNSPLMQKHEDDAGHYFLEKPRLKTPPRSDDGVPSLPRLESSGTTREGIMSSIEQINSMPNTIVISQRPSVTKLHRSNSLIRTTSASGIDRDLANKIPLSFLVAEDNKINRKLLVSMLSKFGYRNILEAHDGAEAVRQMSIQSDKGAQVDVVLMDLWMPLMDGYAATERILEMDWSGRTRPTVLAVTADVTEGALEKAAQAGMKGFMTKPYKLQDLQRLITEYCAQCLDETSIVNEGRPGVLPQTIVTT